MKNMVENNGNVKGKKKGEERGWENWKRRTGGVKRIVMGKRTGLTGKVWK